MARETIAGRTAAGDLVSHGWDAVVAVVEQMPKKAKTLGIEDAIRFERTQMRTVVDSISLARPRTAAQAKIQHEAHVAIGAAIRLMLEDSYAGAECRAAVLEGIERNLLAPSIRTVFDASKELGDDEYVPEV